MEVVMLVVTKRADHRIVGVTRTEGALILSTKHGKIKLEPKSSEIIRVVYTLKDTFSALEKPGILDKDIYEEWTYNETDQEIILTTGKLSLKLNKKTASIQYCDDKEKLLLKERDYESKNLEEFSAYKTVIDEDTRVEKVVTPDGIKEIVKDANKVFDQKLYRSRLYLEWQEGEALYGLGQQEEGCLNLRGTTVFLHQANKKIAIPCLISSLGYGILVDTYSPMIFNDTNFGSYLYTEADYEMDFYFIYGSNMDGVIRGYRYLTGKATCCLNGRLVLYSHKSDMKRPEN
jgi:alpha-D-xyloside xylohydrolase